MPIGFGGMASAWSTIALPEAKMVRDLFLVGGLASSAKLNLASSACIMRGSHYYDVLPKH